MLMIWAKDEHLANLYLFSPCAQGATGSVVKSYDEMTETPEFKSPLSWKSEGFSLDSYTLVFLPGGHEKGVRQVIDSEKVHELLVDFFPKTKKPGKKVVGAVCHGVMVLSSSKDKEGNSVIRDCVTTALPTRFEQTAYWGTRLVLGDYYKTYGACSENVQESVSYFTTKEDPFAIVVGGANIFVLQVTKVLKDPSQFKNSLNAGSA